MTSKCINIAHQNQTDKLWNCNIILGNFCQTIQYMFKLRYAKLNSTSVINLITLNLSYSKNKKQPPPPTFPNTI